MYKDIEKNKVMDPSGFVVLSEYIPDVILEIRYYSTFNFIGDRVDGYEEPTALITKEAADALKSVSDELKKQSYRLKVYDAYRPVSAVDHFVRWGSDFSDTRMKRYFYPDLEKQDVFGKYIASRSSHSRGSTVDLTLFDMITGRDADMGGPFDLFSEISHPGYRDVTVEQYQNRMRLRRVMLSGGFEPYECEWWHFTLKDEPYPDTYFEFPVSAQYLHKCDMLPHLHLR